VQRLDSPWLVMLLLVFVLLYRVKGTRIRISTGEYSCSGVDGFTVQSLRWSSGTG
jgi:hypothetical protein